MEQAGRGRPWVTGAGLLALVLLLTWVSSGPDVNLFAPFDDEATGVGGAAGSYERYEGLENVARGSATGGVWVLVLVVLLACLGAALILWLVSRVGLRLPRRQRQPQASGPEPVAEWTTAGTGPALQVVLNELSTGDDPRSSIIAAWRTLEAASTAAGGALAISRTPNDVTGMLAALIGDRQASEDFERIYLAARYSNATVTEASRQQAVTLLTQLRAQLSLVAGGGGGGQ